MEHTVKVFDELCTVRVRQKSKSVFVAVGDYKGKTFDGEGRSESAALSSWYRAASYWGKDPWPEGKTGDPDPK